MDEQNKNIYLLSFLSFPTLVFTINYLKPNWIYVIDNKGNVVLCEKLLYSYSLLFSLLLLLVLLILKNTNNEDLMIQNVKGDKVYKDLEKNLTNNSSGSKVNDERILEANIKLNIDKKNKSFFPTFYYD
tara:strand:- start:235 stop:621 length:387 start_codon:yes stop_codon:yes gene_type:complete